MTLIFTFDTRVGNWTWSKYCGKAAWAWVWISVGVEFWNREFVTNVVGVGVGVVENGWTVNELNAETKEADTGRYPIGRLDGLFGGFALGFGLGGFGTSTKEFWADADTGLICETTGVGLSSAGFPSGIS